MMAVLQMHGPSASFYTLCWRIDYHLMNCQARGREATRPIVLPGVIGRGSGGPMMRNIRIPSRGRLLRAPEELLKACWPKQDFAGGSRRSRKRNGWVDAWCLKDRYVEQATKTRTGHDAVMTRRDVLYSRGVKKGQ